MVDFSFGMIVRRTVKGCKVGTYDSMLTPSVNSSSGTLRQVGDASGSGAGGAGVKDGAGI